jgi:hypothetical protein
VELCAARAEAAETDGRNDRAVELARLGRQQRQCLQGPLQRVQRPSLAQAAGRLGGSTEGESERWRESCCQASTRSVQTADESFRPAQHQRLAPELARPLCLQLAGTHGNSTGSRG